MRPISPTIRWLSVGPTKISGLAQLADRQTAAAVEACASAVHISEELARNSSGKLSHLIDLARAYSNLAKAQFANGQLTEAEENHRQAIEIRGQLIQDAPAIDVYRHLTASSCHDLADVLRATGRLHGAAGLYQAAIEIHESLVDQKNSTTYQSSLRKDLIACADVFAELGDWSQSAAAYQKASQYDPCTVEVLVARAFAQWAAQDNDGYQETCAELQHEYANETSPQSSFLVALALVVGKPGADDAKAALDVARHAAAVSAQPQTAILVGVRDIGWAWSRTRPSPWPKRLVPSVATWKIVIDRSSYG